MIEHMDEAIGGILAELAKHGLDENTIVVFTSDNGGTTDARPTPFRGFKGSTFEGGVRVPCIVRWPGKIPDDTTTEQIGIMMDWTRSFLRVVGAKLDGEAPLDGIDLLERLEKRETPATRTLYWRARRGDSTWWAVRDGDMKYVAHRKGERKEEYLFDLARDVGEKSDLLPAQAETAERMRRLMTVWEAEVRPRR
jgi:arylsulfatase A-like enzyme